MTVVIDIQSLLPRMRAIGSALQVLASVTDASERVSEPNTPEQRRAMQLVNVERGKLYEELLTLMVKPQAKHLAEASSITVDLIEAADNELNSLRRDAGRYRELREHWLRIEDGSTVHCGGGLDLWCDERLSALLDQSPKS